MGLVQGVSESASGPALKVPGSGDGACVSGLGAASLSGIFSEERALGGSPPWNTVCGSHCLWTEIGGKWRKIQDVGTMSQTPVFSPNSTVPGPVGLSIWDVFVMAGCQQPHWQQVAGLTTNQFLIRLQGPPGDLKDVETYRLVLKKCTCGFIYEKYL